MVPIFTFITKANTFRGETIEHADLKR